MDIERAIIDHEYEIIFQIRKITSLNTEIKTNMLKKANHKKYRNENKNKTRT